jgi:mono/diheme cytochrome c family protein
MMHRGTSFVALAVIGIAGASAFFYSGLYDMGADTPHWPVVEKGLGIFRERSIERHAKDIRVPDLKDAQLILKGAGQYSAMCVECHLAPGITDSEIRPGLYPMPPDLSKTRIDPREAFWAVKHGIKMSGMPAWGLGHDDATLWSIVAFVNKLPDLSPQAYRELVAKAPPDEEMESMSHEKGHDPQPSK